MFVDPFKVFGGLGGGALVPKVIHGVVANDSNAFFCHGVAEVFGHLGPASVSGIEDGEPFAGFDGRDDDEGQVGEVLDGAFAISAEPFG